MTLDITQFYQTFFDEADELLAQMEQLLLNLDIAQPGPRRPRGDFPGGAFDQGRRGDFRFYRADGN